MLPAVTGATCGEKLPGYVYCPCECFGVPAGDAFGLYHGGCGPTPNWRPPGRPLTFATHTHDDATPGRPQ